MEKDIFEILRVGKLQRSTILNKKERDSARKAALEIQFGFNLKRDNANKTKQIKLF